MICDVYGCEMEAVTWMKWENREGDQEMKLCNDHTISYKKISGKHVSFGAI